VRSASSYLEVWMYTVIMAFQETKCLTGIWSNNTLASHHHFVPLPPHLWHASRRRPEEGARIHLFE
jgi:hypothetical protein